MKFFINNNLINLYKINNKNPNYMLDYYLTNIDYNACIENMQLLKNFELNGEKSEIEISNDNINYIKDLFKTIDNKLIETLLWLAIFLKEV